MLLHIIYILICYIILCCVILYYVMLYFRLYMYIYICIYNKSTCLNTYASSKDLLSDEAALNPLYHIILYYISYRMYYIYNIYIISLNILNYIIYFICSYIYIYVLILYNVYSM